MSRSRSRSSILNIPDDLYYLTPGFPSNTLTIPKLKGILLKHHVSSADCHRKADYMELFETKVLAKREKIIRRREAATEAGIKMAILQTRVTEVEEDSDNDASARTPPTTESKDSNDEEAAEIGGPSGVDLEALLESVSVSTPSSGPSKSGQTSKQPVPSPSPVRKLPTLFMQLDVFADRITSLEHSVRQADTSMQDALKAQSKQIKQLKKAIEEICVFVYGKKAGIEIGHGNGKGKGKERASDNAVDTTDEEEEL